MKIGDRIKYFRLQKGMTQKRLAEEVGLAEITIRQYEANKREPKDEIIRKLVKALDVNIHQLIDDSVGNESIKFEKELISDNPVLKTYVRTNLTDSPIFHDTMEHAIHEALHLDAGSESLVINYNKLNDEGKYEARKQVANLTKIKAYLLISE